MQDGWRDDLRWLKEDLKRTQRELETKSSTREPRLADRGTLATTWQLRRAETVASSFFPVNRLVAERQGVASTHVADLSALRAHHVTFHEQHASGTATALKQLGLLSDRTEQDRGRTESLGAEFARLRTAMIAFDDEAEAGLPPREDPAPTTAASSLVEGVTG